MTHTLTSCDVCPLPHPARGLPMGAGAPPSLAPQTQAEVATEGLIIIIIIIIINVKLGADLKLLPLCLSVSLSLSLSLSTYIYIYIEREREMLYM